MCTSEKLLEHIEVLRNKMMTVAIEKGFTSKESIKLSQELDRMLNRYNRKKNATEK